MTFDAFAAPAIAARFAILVLGRRWSRIVVVAVGRIAIVVTGRIAVVALEAIVDLDSRILFRLDFRLGQLVAWTRFARSVAGVHAASERSARRFCLCLRSSLRCGSSRQRTTITGARLVDGRRLARRRRFARQFACAAALRCTLTLFDLNNSLAQLLLLDGVEAATAAVALVHNLVLHATAILQRYRAFDARAGDVDSRGVKQIDVAADIRVFDRDVATLSGGGSG